MKAVTGWEQDLQAKLHLFADRWKVYHGTEQAGAQEFLQKLLEIYEVGFKPGTVFEQHPVKVMKATQGGLFGDEPTTKQTTERMDMYLPKVCVWEMKGPGEKDLGKHHDQLLGYWARVRARYMVLCNFHEFWIYDTADDDGQMNPKLKLPLTELPARFDALMFLRGEEPDLARRSEEVTAEVAKVLGRIVRQVSEDTAEGRERIAKFVLQSVFAMFAEDTDLIPPSMFTKALEKAEREGRLDAVFTLFDDFARKDPGKHNAFAPYVNGPLFDRNLPKVKLLEDQIHALTEAAKFNWLDVRPEIFGSIFEQALDPVLRHELGAHFTREEDISRVVWPTIITPWQQRIAALKTSKDAEKLIEEMKAFQVLDPACGCGNFLYVVYREMKRLEVALARKWVVLEKKVAKRLADVRPAPPRPWFTIQQLHGIEINGFAAFLARVVLWIGEHLAISELGLDEQALPLKNLDQNIVHGDALFMDWPRPVGDLAIVSNPPYLGVRRLRAELGDEYVEKLFAAYPENRAADYVTYWFTQAMRTLRPGERAGYVCTNSVTQNESREASIDRVLAAKGTITDAWKSYPWPGEASVHISIVNWTMAPYDGIRLLDGAEVGAITPSLTSGSDVSRARILPSNRGLSFMGVTPGNTGFVLNNEERAQILSEDPGSEPVIKPFLIGRDVNQNSDRAPSRWIIDFGYMERDQAERYVGAFRHVQRVVYPVRKDNRREAYAKYWWRFVEARRGLREGVKDINRCIVMSCITKHFVLAFSPTNVCLDHRLFVFTLEDWYHFGVLHSRYHLHWGLSRGGTLEDRFAYTGSTIFETFPFPTLPDGRYDPRVRPDTAAAAKVAQAAEAFDTLRSQLCVQRQQGLTKIHNDLEDGKLPELWAAYEAMNDAVTDAYGFPARTWQNKESTLRCLLDFNFKLTDGLGLGRAPLVSRDEEDDAHEGVTPTAP